MESTAVTVAGETVGTQNDLVTLLGFSVAMFFGAFIAGYAPMCMAAGSGGPGTSTSTQSGRVRMLTLFGAGILTGTALNIIIPEGIEMFLASRQAAEAAASGHGGSGGAHQQHEHDHGHEHGGHSQHHGHPWQIGAAMATGFAFMLLVERVGAGSGGGHGHAHVSVNDGSSRSGSGLELAGIGVKRERKECDGSKTSTAMLGLMVHAAIDGVALGASTYSGNGKVSFIIFAAIMLHKAPAAFGLTVYLTSLEHHRRAVQQQLLVFSLAAPAGAIVTFYGMYLNVLGVQATQLALVMLFSAGTFLFVATVHIMPSVMKDDQKLTWSEVWVMVAGIMLPIFLNVEHGH
mmetsp:Transcript_15533/g.40251  ORF Transcript_15533/g.40251 Transcript_15533/m.40251 type:complete len:346 (+) Transcript_15533:235-1272(+)